MAPDGITSGYAAVPLVRPRDVKSITPFVDSNRHGSSAIMNDDEIAKTTRKIVKQDIITTRLCSETKKLDNVTTKKVSLSFSYLLGFLSHCLLKYTH